MAQLSPLAPARTVRIGSLADRIAAGDPVAVAALGSTFAPAERPDPPEGGRFVEIPPGTSVEEQIVLAYDAAGPTPYTLVYAGPGSRAVIVERMSGIPSGDRHHVTEVIAAEGAEITYAAVCTVDGTERLRGERRSRAAADARVRWALALLGSAPLEDRLVADLAGPGARTEIAALFFPVGRETVALTTGARHTVARTASDTVVRAIGAGRGRGSYHGNIRIEPHAHGAVASLRDDTLLIGSTARIDAIPALEIAANDVRAFHGATVGAIDDDNIFYLMSRGIERAAAEELIALGFFEPALAGFPGEALREELRSLLAAKLAGTHA